LNNQALWHLAEVLFYFEKQDFPNPMSNTEKMKYYNARTMEVFTTSQFKEDKVMENVKKIGIWTIVFVFIFGISSVLVKLPQQELGAS